MGICCMHDRGLAFLSTFRLFLQFVVSFSFSPHKYIYIDGEVNVFVCSVLSVSTIDGYMRITLLAGYIV